MSFITLASFIIFFHKINALLNVTCITLFNFHRVSYSCIFLCTIPGRQALKWPGTREACLHCFLGVLLCRLPKCHPPLRPVVHKKHRTAFVTNIVVKHTVQCQLSDLEHSVSARVAAPVFALIAVITYITNCQDGLQVH